MPNDDGSEIHHPSYETGYREGGSSREADWVAALSEEFDVESFDTPQEFVKALLRAWQPMETAPRDGSDFVVKQRRTFQNNDSVEAMIVSWSEYADSEGGWWLAEGAVIAYETCEGWWPVPPL